MPPQTTGKQSPMDALNWRVNNIDTKTRINEQNILNERRHVQLINTNLLALKKELRNKISEISRENAEIKKSMQVLETKIIKMEETIKKHKSRRQITKEFTKPRTSKFKAEMSSQQADKVLDEIIKGTGGSK